MPIDTHGFGTSGGARTGRPAIGARFDALQFRVRIILVAAMALSAALLPIAGDNRYWVALFLATVALPAHYVLRAIVGTPNPTGWLDLLSAVASTLVAAIEPALFAPSFLFQLMNVASSGAYLTVRWTRLISAFALTSMFAVILIRPVPSSSITMFVVAGSFLPALTFGARQRRAREQRSAERVNSIVDHLPVLVWEASAHDGSIITVVGDPERVLGRGRDELLGDRYRALIHEDDVGDFDRRFRTGHRGRIRYRFRHGDGTWLWIVEHSSLVTVRAHAVIRGVVIDVTSERQARDDVIRQSEIVQRLSAATIVLDQHRDLNAAIILDATDPPCDLFDAPDEAVGRRLAEVLPELIGHRWLSEGFRRLPRRTTVQTGVHQIAREDGTSISAELQLFTLPDGTSAIVIENVSEREAASATIRHQASHDDLTGLANRVKALPEMRQQLDAGMEFSLAVIDLNDFKAINDALGHSTGDQLLRVIGQRLKNAVGPQDLVARLGGDEFAVVLIGRNDIDARLERLVDACRERVSVSGSALAVGVSIGVSGAPHHANDVESLFRLADIAMYRAKRSRHTILHYQPSDEQAPDRLDLMADLAEAFTLGQFVPYFQPKVTIATGEIAGAEVLARWHHPTRGVLKPHDFLQLVALAGHLDDLLRAMLWSSLQVLKDVPEHINMSLNLSAVNLRRADLNTTVTDALSSLEIDPSRLTVELTEGEFVEDNDLLEKALRELASLGIGISVDDFGTGFSSLVHLQTLPLTELKIDQRFVRNLTSAPRDRAIVESLISLGHALGVVVTAEGVDQPDTLHALETLGCDLAQGYLLGRPLDAHGFVRLVQGERTTSGKLAE